MTVRQVFEKAYGPLPRDTTGCYIGAYGDVQDIKPRFRPTIKVDDYELRFFDSSTGKWVVITTDSEPIGPAICLRTGSSFRGFFGKEFDDIIEEERKQDLAIFQNIQENRRC